MSRSVMRPGRPRRRVLLSDGAGLTGREVATALSRAGHVVEVMSPDTRALTRFTRHVAKVHPAPCFGDDPFAWLDSVCDVLGAGRFDALVPTQEQVAVLAACPHRVRDLGVGLAVPPFDALARVQDKLAAAATLAELGLPQPPSSVARSVEALRTDPMLPAFVKTAIGTASAGVTLVRDRDEIDHLAQLLVARRLDASPLLVQVPIDGPVVMIQAVFARGRLVASHAVVRTRDGRNGGASSKRSIDLPVVRTHLAVLGEALAWHGALSLDAILTSDGPSYIDINPRIIEPINGLFAGVDLASALLSVSLDEPLAYGGHGNQDVQTHLVLQAVAGAAARGRRAVAGELLGAVTHRGPYRGSREELTPLRGDPTTLVPVALAALALLASPSIVDRFESGAVGSYALTAEAWEAIKAHAR